MGEKSKSKAKKKRGGSPMKTKEKEEEQVTATPNSEERCSKSNGKGWRCKEFRVAGENLCNHHLDLKRSPASRVSIDAETKTEEEGEETPTPTYGEGCSKNDGKGWRCKEFCLAGEKLCKHHLDLSLKRKKTPARVSGDGKRKAAEPSTSRAEEDHEWASKAAELLKAAMAKLNGKGKRPLEKDGKERTSETIRRKLAVVKLMIAELERDLEYLTDLEVEKNDLGEMLA